MWQWIMVSMDPTCVADNLGSLCSSTGLPIAYGNKVNKVEANGPDIQYGCV